MRDVVKIADALADAHARGEPAVLATVVRTEGSTYRRAGARMLLRRGGLTVGAVSGGCLEADIAARVDALLADGRPRLVTYDGRAAEDLVWGLGLGCDGRVDVLLEPLAGDALAGARALYARCRELTAPAVLTKVIAVTTAQDDHHPRVGDWLLLTADGVVASSDPMHAFGPPVVLEDARGVLESRRPAVRSYGPTRGLGGAIEVLHEPIAPPISLLVCGAGADALPLVHVALGLGWRVSVADHRPDHARPDRFAGADVFVHDRSAAAIDALVDRRCDAAVVMSHHYECDAIQVRALLMAGVPYVGILGPRRRTERMIAELGAHGQAATRLYAPVGLDIGAETPEEIAIAVVAEVQAVRAGRRGGMLRDRAGPIHPEILSMVPPPPHASCCAVAS
jgi:xanthine/CO dehydrogenase XdhC/CoxF family maturation factor